MAPPPLNHQSLDAGEPRRRTRRRSRLEKFYRPRPLIEGEGHTRRAGPPVLPPPSSPSTGHARRRNEAGSDRGVGKAERLTPPCSPEAVVRDPAVPPALLGRRPSPAPQGEEGTGGSGAPLMGRTGDRQPEARRGGGRMGVSLHRGAGA